MAKGGNVMKKSLAELDKEITCAICQEHCTEPKLQPCRHYFCKNKAKLTQLSTAPAKCTVSGEGAKAAVLNTISEASLTTSRPNCKVDCHLKSLSNQSIIKCNIDQTGARNYSIQYTPTVRGRCELTVSVDGQQVADSPFPVFVSVPVAQLGRLVSVWRGVSLPTGIAVNSVGEVVVSEADGDVIIFDKEGKRLRSVQRKLEWCYVWLLMERTTFTALI